MDHIKSPFQPILQIHDQLEKALNIYYDTQYTKETVIHEMRRCFKKVRSLLNLYASILNTKELKKLELLIASSARLYTISRESLVNLITFEFHQENLCKIVNPETVNLLHQNLYDFKVKHYRKSVVDKLYAQMKDLIEKFLWVTKSANLPSLTKESLYESLKYTFLKGRELYREVLKDPETETVHDWRKQVKRLHFQTSYLHSCGFHENTVILDIQRDIGSYLGRDHDMAIMLEFLKSMPCYKEMADKELINKYFNEQIINNRKKAIDLGETIFSLKKKRFLQLLNTEI